ncbi:MAG: Zn-ribbon domain-containing OB-fold protein [Rhodospirillales bacterium]|nr:Zn-ribbon domain-containing OB-fold protein [Rhodospirillales bacterium]
MQEPRQLRNKYTARFWDALQQNRLMLPRCRDCGHWLFPIGPCCSNCLSDALEWTPLSGKGEVWSFIVYHHAFAPEFKDKLPYNVAIVKLDEGPRIISNVVGIANDEIRNGMRVAAQFDPVDEAHTLLRFRPDATA